MKIFTFLFVLFLAVGIFYFFYYPNLSFVSPSLKEAIKKELSEPGPLRYTKKSTRSFLTIQGTLDWTNSNRADNNLKPLILNNELNIAAKAKMDDMFARQYFAHYGPGNTSSAGVLAEKYGYEYIAVGENLALGNFADDKELVQAWMDSPGHKANILNSKFEEIGIAVGKGIFEGESTWIAVQIFAKPASSCPQVSESLKKQIDLNQTGIDRLQSQLELKKQELESYQPKRGAEYNQKVKEYNELVGEYNSLTQQTKALVNQYNEQVRQYNTCLQN